MECADVAVVGAGVLGCFAARALAQRALAVLVPEARSSASGKSCSGWSGGTGTICRRPRGGCIPPVPLSTARA